MEENELRARIVVLEEAVALLASRLSEGDLQRFCAALTSHPNTSQDTLKAVDALLRNMATKASS